MTLDPEIAVFVDRLNDAWAGFPPLDVMSVPETRAAAECVRAPWRAGGPAMASVQEVEAPLVHGGMRLRIYRPEGLPPGPAPALLFLHGGGFSFFSLDTHDRLMREYAAAGGFVVVGVDYPLAPEHRFPIALEQVAGLVDWLAGLGPAVGIDPAFLALGGDSVGANLSLAATMRLRDAGRVTRVCGILSNYGAFSDDISDAAEAAYGGPDALLCRAEMVLFFDRYVRTPGDRRDPLACPLLATDLAGLPPTLFVIPERDVLREQSESLHARFTAAGVPSDCRIYPGTTHSFLEAMSISGVARRAIGDGAGWLSRRFRSVGG